MESLYLGAMNTIGNTFKVEAQAWARYLKLKAERAALDREVKALEASFGFPSADQVAEDATYVIVNGNADEVGKLSFYHYSGAVIPPGWRRRIS